ncbi:hypothetical protein ACJ72_02449 [Emergomyces africanus]|uniref:Uncharacterized protein n=1 Tax=Emergomyces africanus TaxID=1955775 RepID=A0A1B7P2E9_9EURO|nr:hypothetical protein ACJ72_02449 [Emergomyces africanus]
MSILRSSGMVVSVISVSILHGRCMSANEESDYCCQDFVLDVLDKLEEDDIIDVDSGDYESNKAAIQEKRESWK